MEGGYRLGCSDTNFDTEKNKDNGSWKAEVGRVCRRGKGCWNSYAEGESRNTFIFHEKETNFQMHAFIN